jgi:hypothetical protein
MDLPNVSAELRRERQVDMLRLCALEVERDHSTSMTKIMRLTKAIDALNEHIFVPDQVLHGI